MLGFEGMKEEIGNLEKCGLTETPVLKRKHP